ncbi:MAG: YveK family protein [Acutalibacteraceae bacterium]
MDTFNIFFMLKIAAKHFVAILLGAVIAATAAYAYSKYFTEPQYSATGSICVTNGAIISDGTNVDQSDPLQNADIVASLNFVETVKDILDTPGIYKQLSKDIANKYTFTQLKSKISIRRRSERSLFIDISFTSTSREEAVSLVNKYLDTAPDYISSYVPNVATAVTHADYANQAQLNASTVMFIAAILGAAVVYVIIFLIYSADTVIRDEESFKQRFDVPVIGIVPDFSSAKGKEDRYYRYYGRYGHYSYGGNK